MSHIPNSKSNTLDTVVKSAEMHPAGCQGPILCGVTLVEGWSLALRGQRSNLVVDPKLLKG